MFHKPQKGPDTRLSTLTSAQSWDVRASYTFLNVKTLQSGLKFVPNVGGFSFSDNDDRLRKVGDRINEWLDEIVNTVGFSAGSVAWVGYLMVVRRRAQSWLLWDLGRILVACESLQ